MSEYHYNLFILFGIAFIAFFVVGFLVWEMIKSQLRFQAICENSGSFVVIGKGISGKNNRIIDIEIVGCNEVYAHHLHKNVSDIVGLHITGDFFNGVEPDWMDVVRDVIITHESRHLDFSYEPMGTRYTGTVFCLSPFRKRCCFIMDETSADFKRRNELVRVRKLMDVVLEMSGIAIWEWDLKTDHINVIKTTINIVSEYWRKDVSASDMQARIHPDDSTALTDLRNNLPTENKPAMPVEYRLKDDLGGWRWFQAVAVKANYDEEGDPETLIGVTFDIDSLKRTQLQLQEISKEFEINQNWLMYSLQQSRTGYCRWDVKTDQLYLSENFWQSVCGLTPEQEDCHETPRTMMDFIDLMVIEEPENFNEFLKSVYSGYPQEFTFRCYISFVPERYLEIRTNVLERDQNGQVKVVSAFIIDITEMRKNESALRSAMEAADEANKAKSRFLAVMSHEIRTPLNAIIGFSSMLREADIANQLKSYAESIKNSGEMLLYLINDLLDLAKIESSKMELKFEPVNLFNLLSEIKGMFEFKLNSKQLYLDLVCDPDLPVFNLDFKRVQQIFINLIGNAVKFTHQGGITVKVIAKPLHNSRGRVDHPIPYKLVISVRDTGVGIPEKDFTKIFNPFEQATNNHEDYVEGTGLGLTICRNLVELMGGTLTFESNADQGSKFIVVLNEVETVTESQEIKKHKSVLSFPHAELDETPAWKPVSPEVLARVQSLFGKRFADLTTGLHVQAANALVEDLVSWMDVNNFYELRGMVECLQKAVTDFDVMEVRRTASLFMEQRDEHK